MIIILFFPPSYQQFITATLHVCLGVTLYGWLSVNIQLLTKLSNWLTTLHAYSEVTLYGWLGVNIQLLTKLTNYNPCLFWGDPVGLTEC